MPSLDFVAGFIAGVFSAVALLVITLAQLVDHFLGDRHDHRS